MAHCSTSPCECWLAVLVVCLCAAFGCAGSVPGALSPRQDAYALRSACLPSAHFNSSQHCSFDPGRAGQAEAEQCAAYLLAPLRSQLLPLPCRRTASRIMAKTWAHSCNDGRRKYCAGVVGESKVLACLWAKRSEVSARCKQAVVAKELLRVSFWPCADAAAIYCSGKSPSATLECLRDRISTIENDDLRCAKWTKKALRFRHLRVYKHCEADVQSLCSVRERRFMALRQIVACLVEHAPVVSHRCSAHLVKQFRLPKAPSVLSLSCNSRTVKQCAKQPSLSRQLMCIERSSQLLSPTCQKAVKHWRSIRAQCPTESARCWAQGRLQSVAELPACLNAHVGYLSRTCGRAASLAVRDVSGRWDESVDTSSLPTPARRTRDVIAQGIIAVVSVFAIMAIVLYMYQKRENAGSAGTTLSSDDEVALATFSSEFHQDIDRDSTASGDSASVRAAPNRADVYV